MRKKGLELNMNLIMLVVMSVVILLAILVVRQLLSGLINNG